jgi:hypothetical protein
MLASMLRSTVMSEQKIVKSMDLVKVICSFPVSSRAWEYLRNEKPFDAPSGGLFSEIHLHLSDRISMGSQ